MKLISTYLYDRYVGGAKAKEDIEKIVNSNFKNISIETVKEYKDKSNNLFSKTFLKLKKIFCVLKNAFSSEIKIIQVPFTKNKLMIFIKNKVALIHDIHGLQFQQSKILQDELNFYKSCKFVIVHNNKMKNYLICQGIDESKIITLELFDYLVCDQNNNMDRMNILSMPITIIYSGNLLEKKIPFLYQIEDDKIDFNINLYGMGINKNISDKIIYKGSYSPKELPNKIEGDLGLIWDGNLDESDENYGFKNYTKYNNPHKLSCYIAAGIPVIVWEKAAIADLVKKYDIGYTINNLYDINNINYADYNIKRENVLKLSKKVQEGYFTKRVINEIIENCNGIKENV